MPAPLPYAPAKQAFREFLGNGLTRPLQRDRKTDFANAQGVDLVRSCVGQVLGTRCSDDSGQYQGELLWRPDFGCLLWRLRHRKGTIDGVMLDELARTYVVDALTRWEPRVVVVASSSEFDLNARTLTVRVRYDIIDRNVPGNNVIASDVETVVSIPTT